MEHPGPQGTGGLVTVCPTRMSGLPQTGRLLFAPLLEYCHKGWVWPWPWPLQKSKGRAREHLYLSSTPSWCDVSYIVRLWCSSFLPNVPDVKVRTHSILACFTGLISVLFQLHEAALATGLVKSVGVNL